MRQQNEVTAHPSPYAQAMAATRETITRRAAQYKFLVISVVLAVIGTTAAVLALHSWRALWVLTFLPCGVIGFFILDALTMQTWRNGILQAWSVASLRLDILTQTLRQVPGLPAQTLEGMLACLPSRPLDEVPLALRTSLLQAQQLLASFARQRLALRGLAWAIWMSVLIVALSWGAATVLLAWGTIPVLALALRAAHDRQVRRARTAALQALQAIQATGPNWTTLRDWMACLDWQAVSAKQRKRWLMP